MKLLHIIRDIKDSWPSDLLAIQKEQGNEVTLLLIHDAVLSQPPAGIKVYACRDDLTARGLAVSPGKKVQIVDYDGVLELIFDHDSVSCW